MNNPWAKRWNNLHSTEPDPGERALARLEAQDAEDAGTRTCGLCGGTAYYRPGVGAFQCPNCRALLVRGTWVR